MINFQGEEVFEENGKRYIIVNQKKVEETTPSIRFCRVYNEESRALLLKSFYLKDFYPHYGKLKTIFDAWVGDDALFKSFQDDALRSLYVTFLHWRSRLDGSAIEWSKWVGLKQGLAGIQLGLKRRIQKESFVIEYGLQEDIQACSLFQKHKLFAFENTFYDISPESHRMGMAEVSEFYHLERHLSQIKDRFATKKSYLFDFPEFQSALKIYWFNTLPLPKEVKESILHHSFERGHKTIAISKEVLNTKVPCCQVGDWFLYFAHVDCPKHQSLVEFAGDPLWKEGFTNQDKIIDGEREFYRPVSQVTQPTAMISSKVANEVRNAILRVKSQVGDIDDWVSNLLQIDKNELKNRLSSEQVDAVALAIQSLQQNTGLIIADETGFGKGRILASVVHIGLNLGKRICFFTENKQLFSDFYRDLTAVSDKPIIPFILNQSGRIYSQEGELIAKNLSAPKYNAIIDSKTDWEAGEVPFIVTNYAQINKKSKNMSKDLNKNVQFIERLMGDNCWYILDEAHNASGNSNINQHLMHLINKSQGVLFSSATYAKTEEKLALYRKAMPLSKVTEKLVKLSLSKDNGMLREMLTKEMSRLGHFIRREHPPIDLPEYFFIDVNPDYLSRFSAMWQEFAKLVQLRLELIGSEASCWLTMGAVMSRSIREFNMLSKIEGLAQDIIQRVQSNKKVVIVTEITFEAALKQLVESGEISVDLKDTESIDFETKTNQKEFDEEPNWNLRWYAYLHQLMDAETLEKEIYRQRFNPDTKYDPKLHDERWERLVEQAERVEKAIEQMDFFGLSPLDKLANILRAQGIKVNELSGRSYQVVQQNDKWVINNQFGKIERQVLVSQFNNEDTHVMILTGAGASGISLHASEAFKDQRQRCLIEWDIASNAANRIQFWGRVRRKGQISEPLFASALLNTLSDRRKIELEKRKQIYLSAHVGGVKENKLLDWISREGEWVLEEWLSNHHDVAKNLGLLSTPEKMSKLLSRAMLLPEDVQQDLFQSIESGINAHNDFHFYCLKPEPISQKIGESFHLGQVNKAEINDRISPLNLSYTTLTTRRWFLPNLETSKEMKEAIFHQIRENKGSFEEEKTKLLNGLKHSKWIQLVKSLSSGMVFMYRFGVYTKRGVIVDLHVPENPTLNNSVLDVYFEGENTSIKMPVFLIKNSKLLGGFNMQSFYPASYVNTLCLEGNPILISNWHKKTGLGELLNIIDENDGAKVILMLKGLSYAQVQSIAPFITIEQFMNYFYDGEIIYNHYLPEKSTISVQYVKKSIKNYYGEVYDKMVMEIRFQSKKMFKRQNWMVGATKSIALQEENKDGTYSIFIHSSFMGKCVSLMKEAGIYFFCPADWFNQKISQFL